MAKVYTVVNEIGKELNTYSSVNKAISSLNEIDAIIDYTTDWVYGKYYCGNDRFTKLLEAKKRDFKKIEFRVISEDGKRFEYYTIVVRKVL